jgi:SAM-dependent methyltransferase
MAQNSDRIDYREDYYRGFSKIYFNAVIQTIIDFGDLKNEKNIVLDYGCGVGHLKQTLKSANIVGYDIIPELSDLADYKVLKPSKIVLSNVLEHMYLAEIEKLLKDFILMNDQAPLLVVLPTENFVSKMAMLLAGQTNCHDDHVSNYKAINNLIEKYYYPQKRKYIFLKMSQFTYYIPIEH